MTQEAIFSAIPWALTLSLIIMNLLRAMIVVIVVLRIPPDHQADILKAIAELYRSGRGSGAATPNREDRVATPT